MKRSLAFSLALIFASLGIAQQTQVIKYEEVSGKENEQKMPDLRNTTVAFAFGGSLTDKTIGWLRKKSVKRFATSCKNVVDKGEPVPVVCISFGDESSTRTSGSGYSGGSGRNGGGSGGGSWSGDHVDIVAHAKLFVPGEAPRELGYAHGWAEAGTQSSYGNSYGSRFSSSSNVSITTPRGIALARAEDMAVSRLFDHHKVFEIGSHSKEWYVGDQELIDKTFGPRKTSHK